MENNIKKCFKIQISLVNIKKQMICNLFEIIGNPFNLGVITSIDGVAFFKSSKTSMWPIVGSISNLPPTVRDKQENITLFGIFVDDKFPSTELITTPFCQTMRKNFEQGKLIIFILDRLNSNYRNTNYNS